MIGNNRGGWWGSNRMRLWITISLLATLGCTGRRSAVVPPAPEPAAPVVARTPEKADSGVPAMPAMPAPRGIERAHTTDIGVFPELAPRVRLGDASWIDRSAGLVVANRFGDSFLFVGGRAVAFLGDATPDVVVAAMTGADHDDDGIPDQLDVLLGAKKAALNHAAYGSPYREIDYPGGDVPRDEGVCTDVVVRAVRNAGIDLQQTLHDDIVAHRAAFEMVKTPNANIDHRRVKTLLPHFERTWVALRPDPNDILDPWLPGDIVLMQTLGDPRPDHIGIVSDLLGPSGAPLIVNNWTDGYATEPLDIAHIAPITHRFRIPSELALPAPHAGLAGLLHRRGLTVAPEHEQLLVVTTPGWSSVGGQLQRFVQHDGRFEPVGRPIAVTVGATGLGSGRGLHGDAVRGASATKHEGDRRSPAGVFELGTAFGSAVKPFRGSWPYRRATAADRFVDDPDSAHYNSWQTGDGDWASAERLDTYDVGLVVRHNMPPQPGAGSAIFLHTWGGDPRPTVGCTAMARDDLLTVLAWLDPARRPVLVQVAGHVFARAD